MTLTRLLALSLLLAGSAAAADQQLVSTTLHGSVTDVKDAIVHALLARGWSVGQDASYRLELTKPTKGGAYVLSEMLLGNGGSGKPQEVLTFDLAPGPDTVSVVMRDAISVEYANGTVRDTPLNSKRLLKEERDFLSTLQASIDHRAAAASLVPIAPGLAERPKVGLGVDFATNDSSSIAKVWKDGPAEKAGLLVGDVVFAIDGKTVAAASSILQTVNVLTPGQVIRVTVIRDGHLHDFGLTLGEAPVI